MTLTPEEKAALERLITLAEGPTGQSRRVADFLLAWWNSAECGGFDLTSLWALDEEINHDVVTVFGYIARSKSYPDALGFASRFETIVRERRPELQAA